MYPSKIRLATNSHLMLLRCEREFQKIELLQGQEAEGDESDSSSILTFGKAWGEGIVEYLITGNLDSAVYAAWLAYCPILEDEYKGRQEEFVYNGLRVAKEKLDRIREEWEVAYFHNKPARELGFRININERYYYESSIDAALVHKRDRYIATMENKHTHHYLEDVTPMYKNQAQALIYSIVTDKISDTIPASIPLHYFVGQFTKSDGLHKPRIHHFRWKKTLLDRLNLFVALGMDVERLQRMVDINIFPMRGHSCLRYNRPCQFFGTCQLRANDRPKTDEYVEKNKSQHVKEVEASVQFVFSLDEIVKDHLERVKEELVK